MLSSVCACVFMVEPAPGNVPQGHIQDLAKVGAKILIFVILAPACSLYSYKQSSKYQHCYKP